MKELIIGIDIDGVLGAFAPDIEKFALKKFGLHLVSKYSYPLNERFGIENGLGILEEFIKDDGYKTMMSNKSAIKFFNDIDAKKIIVTSRYPYDNNRFKHLKNKIINDTIFWLDKNNVKRDMVIFTKNKVKKVREHNIQFFFEDYYLNAEEIANYATSFLVTMDWNAKEKEGKSIRINRVEDAGNILLAAKEGESK